MPALRKVIKALVYLFAVIGFVDICGRLLLLPLAGEIYGYSVRLPSDVEILSIVPNPDRSLKAVVYRWLDLGGFNGGCGEFVSVLDGRASDTTGWDASNRVFANDACNHSINVTWEPPAGGRLYPRLRIDADPATALFMSRTAHGGKLAVAYPNDR
jgi:hypothetical protein